MLSINSSIKSLNAQGNLTQSQRTLSTSFERLSSGLRINNASDDAAGLSISTRMSAQVKGVHQSIKNATDWVSLFQTAEGAMSEMENSLQRIRELSVQAKNGTNNDQDRASLQAEVDQLVEGIDSIVSQTSFNGLKILDGELKGSLMQIGANASEGERVTLSKLNSSHLGRAFLGGPNDGADPNIAISGIQASFDGQVVNIRDTVAADDTLSTSLNANSAIAKVKAFNDSINDSRFKFLTPFTETTIGTGISGGTLDNDSFISINNQKISGFKFEANDASGTLVDAINAVTDETGVVASISSSGDLELSAADGRNIEIGVNGLAGEIGGVANGTVVRGGKIVAFMTDTIELLNMNGANDLALGGDGGSSTVSFFPNTAIDPNMPFAASVKTYDISTSRKAMKTLLVIDHAIDQLTGERAKVGALQNRLTSTINNLQVASESLSAARSRIKDADFASESATLARNQIIQQAGVSILTQANQSNSIALSLLQ
jgi:flagellin